MLVQKVRKLQKIENTQASLQVEVLLSQFEWNSRDSPTETRLTDRYRSTDSVSFPRTVIVRRMANDVTYTMSFTYVYNLF